MSFVVAIDGPAGSGKGTVTKLVAEKLNFITIDTGAMYRSAALEAVRKNIAPDDNEGLKKMMDNISIELKKVDNVQKVYLNGEDVTKEIRTPLIDGPAGSGKGTVTKLVAEKLNFITIDTGAMYRSAALEAVRKNIAPDDNEGLKKMMDNISIELKKVDNVQKVYLNGEDVTKEIRTPLIDENSSKYSAIPYIREKITPIQRKMGENGNVIMEGRDIGTVVFPDADVKIFLDASDEEIANRRYKQDLERGMNVTYEQVLEDIKRRNKNDSNRAVAPLKKAEDAIYIDSTNLTINEVVDKVIEIIENKKKEKNI